MRPMVYVPLDYRDLREFRAGGPLPPGPAYAATRALRDAFGFDEEGAEEADYAAQVFASLHCLMAGRDRCVLAVETDRLPAGSGDVDFGEVARPGVRWRDVRAIFVDATDARPALQAYAGSARGRDLASVWADEAAAHVVQEHELLWYDPTELDQVLAGFDAPVKGD